MICYYSIMKNFENENNSRPPFFPMMIDISGKNILIVGGGKVAARRADTLLRCGAKVKAVSKDFISDFPVEAEKIIREFQPEDINQNFEFIIAATNDRNVNNLICRISHEKNIPVNVSDNKNECDFFFPSLINYKNIAVSVCSAGLNKSLTKKLSDLLRKFLPAWIQNK
ncbi:MAG: bifunctional precorrin-2 dehydrogenase/sirohydrochlorin ferrochelatase [Synergistaceae bacterium]|nr:bifunctional precorrin-2 dehydrogenase/sirohydrochlorin ferrochelatase [Synergistaceae bacterium]MBQ6739103.1 bifunctional precorrin-2 dehydrogenase/sirohydrochlorin ferrochelatase [Synergistaceae bacterium]MBR0079317.1 bifunctional precorrin-2 dehydrogenase/sirohydrochlorin ferrochelatase [Synergistaceae bacterium]MBR0254174.1 bifunctional precorrin-2 dehydrogenase/sirohydrochlorin ferrochelatase [Synergistaceae bacterium]